MPAEAQLIHGALFPRHNLPAAVESRYAQARARFFADDAYAPLVEYLAAQHLDPEAVEYALRLRRGPNGLTQRFQVMLTLCEVRSAYDARFVQRHPATLAALAAAPWLALRAAVKLLRGLYLYRVHRLEGRIRV